MFFYRTPLVAASAWRVYIYEDLKIFQKWCDYTNFFMLKVSSLKEIPFSLEVTWKYLGGKLAIFLRYKGFSLNFASNFNRI